LRILIAATLVAAAFAGGLAWGGDDQSAEDAAARRRNRGQMDMRERLKLVRREVKRVDFETALQRIPPLVARERQYQAILDQLAAGPSGDGQYEGLLNQARDLKLAALADLNEILRIHRGKHTGLTEEQVWDRLKEARFTNVEYRDEWLVNILDDLEDSVKINIELDARVYKFDTVSFDFEKSSARAMLQIMGDALLFQYVVRGDTLYVFKERHEILFGGEWIRQKKAAWKARKEALEKARKEAERRALEGGG
jgi:hypothetical protein